MKTMLLFLFLCLSAAGAEFQFDKFVAEVIRFENLKPGQTSIRRPPGTAWKTIHGYRVLPNPPQYPDRRAFIFVSPGNVFPVMKAQFRSYFSRPARFGLDPNPSLPEVLRVYCPPQHADIGRYLDRKLGPEWRAVKGKGL